MHYFRHRAPLSVTHTHSTPEHKHTQCQFQNPYEENAPINKPVPPNTNIHRSHSHKPAHGLIEPAFINTNTQNLLLQTQKQQNLLSQSQSHKQPSPANLTKDSLLPQTNKRRTHSNKHTDRASPTSTNAKAQHRLPPFCFLRRRPNEPCMMALHRPASSGDCNHQPRLGRDDSINCRVRWRYLLMITHYQHCLI